MLLLKDYLENKKPIKRGILCKFNSLLKEFSWAVEMVVKLLMSYFTNPQ